MLRLAPLAAGALFGFFLVRAGATDFDAIASMFTLRDLHLAGVIGVAIVVAGIGLRLHARLTGKPLPASKPMHGGVVVGAAIFGLGWGLTGTCPGTALAQLGEGRLLGGATLLGMLAGTWLHGFVQSRAGATAPRPAT